MKSEWTIFSLDVWSVDIKLNLCTKKVVWLKRPKGMATSGEVSEGLLGLVASDDIEELVKLSFLSFSAFPRN